MDLFHRTQGSKAKDQQKRSQQRIIGYEDPHGEPQSSSWGKQPFRERWSPSGLLIRRIETVITYLLVKRIAPSLKAMSIVSKDIDATTTTSGDYQQTSHGKHKQLNKSHKCKFLWMNECKRFLDNQVSVSKPKRSCRSYVFPASALARYSSTSFCWVSLRTRFG